MDYDIFILVVEAGPVSQQHYFPVLKVFKNEPERFNNFNMKRTVSYLKRNGIRKTCYKVLERLDRDAEEAGCSAAAMNARPTMEELNEQIGHKFLHNYKFSILVPAYNTEPVFLKEMMTSVVKQTYGNWELCIADGSTEDVVGNTVKEDREQLKDELKQRIRYQRYAKCLRS